MVLMVLIVTRQLGRKSEAMLSPEIIIYLSTATVRQCQYYSGHYQAGKRWW